MADFVPKKGSECFQLPNQIFPQTNNFLDFVKKKRLDDIKRISYKINNISITGWTNLAYVNIDYFSNRSDFDEEIKVNNEKAKTLEDLYKLMDELVLEELKSFIKQKFPKIQHDKPSSLFVRVNDENETWYTDEEEDAIPDCPVLLKKRRNEQKEKSEAEKSPEAIPQPETQDPASQPASVTAPDLLRQKELEIQLLQKQVEFEKMKNSEATQGK